MDWRFPLRNSHRSAAARPVAASVAAPASPMRNGVGRTGSAPAEISTRSARSADMPTLGRMEGRAFVGRFFSPGQVARRYRVPIAGGRQDIRAAEPAGGEVGGRGFSGRLRDGKGSG